MNRKELQEKKNHQKNAISNRTNTRQMLKNGLHCGESVFHSEISRLCLDYHNGSFLQSSLTLLCFSLSLFL